MINYMDRMTLSGASVRVTGELGLSELQYGNLELAFGWAFAAGSLVFGFLADRFSVRWLYPCVLGAWSLMGVAGGWSHGFEQLLVCRTLLGFFEAGHWPCAIKTTFALLEEKDRTMGNSILQSGASLGAVVTPQILKALMSEQEGSWRHAFVVVGCIGFLWVAVWFFCVRGRDLENTPTAGPGQKETGMSAILRSGRFWAVAFLIIGAQTAWHIYRVWLMKFLETGRGYEPQAALNFNSVYFVATDVGCILAGVVSLWLARTWGCTPHQSRRYVYCGGCVLTSLSILLPWMDKGWALLVVLLLIGAGSLSLFPCYYSFVQELSPAHVGRLTGILSLWVWGVTSPMHSVFGWIADRTKSYDAGLVAAGLAPWLGVLALWSLWKQDTRSIDVARPVPAEK